MIHYVTGNIFESGCQVLVNPVNCMGVMGAGLAKKFKEKYPDNYLAYRKECTLGNGIRIGRIFVHKCAERETENSPEYIFNFPTKHHWKHKSELKTIVIGLSDLIGKVRELEITSIAIPALGCGLGGLSWMEVKNFIRTAFETFTFENVEVYLYEPK